jgi:hypothetical protein
MYILLKRCGIQDLRFAEDFEVLKFFFLHKSLFMTGLNHNQMSQAERD